MAGHGCVKIRLTQFSLTTYNADCGQVAITVLVQYISSLILVGLVCSDLLVMSATSDDQGKRPRPRGQGIRTHITNACEPCRTKRVSICRPFVRYPWS